MEQNLVINGTVYNGVQDVDIPVSGGGTAKFAETSDATATAEDIAEGKTAYVNGVKLTGTNTGGGGIDSLERRHVYIAYNISGGGNFNANLKAVIDEDLPEGKRVLGIAGFATNNVNIVMISVRYEVSDYGIQLRNVGSTRVSNSALVYYLCVDE